MIVGDQVWFTQGGFHPCTILEINGSKAALKIRGWAGDRHWYSLSQLMERHPQTGKTVAEVDGKKG